MPMIKNNFVIIETANTTYAMMITPQRIFSIFIKAKSSIKTI